MKFVCLFFILVALAGCARVKVEAPEEPIKIDISMRLDIYQHVVKEIDEIEDVVTGAAQEKPAGDNQSRVFNLIKPAYAQQELPPEVREAALRRRERLERLNYFRSRGIVGENRSGLLEIRDFSSADSSVREMVDSENRDRKIIYRAIAEGNNISMQEVQKIYARRLQEDAPAGTPIEVFDSATGSYRWKVK